VWGSGTFVRWRARSGRPVGQPATAARIGSERVALASGGAVLLFGSVVDRLFSFGFIFVIARALGSSGAGAFYQAVGLFTILTLLTQAGAPTALVRMVARERVVGSSRSFDPLLRAALIPTVTLACITTVVLFVGAPWISHALLHHGDRNALTVYLRPFALGLPIVTATSVLLSATQGFGSMLPLTVIDKVVRPSMRMLLALAIFPFTRTPIAIATVWLAPMILCLPLAAIAVVKLRRTAIAHAPAEHVSVAASQRAHRVSAEFWRYALPQSVTSVLQIAVVWLDLLLLGALKGPHEAGVYGTASRYVLVGTLALSAVASAISPLMSSILTAGDKARAEDMYRVGTIWISVISLPIYLIMAVYAPLFMGVFGSSFTDGTRPLTILAVASLANILTGPAAMILLMGGKSGYILMASALSLGVNIALNVLLIPPHGVDGAAIAWVASIVTFNILAVTQVYRTWGIHPFSRGLVKVSTMCAGCFGAIGIILGRSHMTYPMPAAAITVGTVTYALLLSRFRNQLGASAFLAAWRGR
jgi:O-antigen/teichoic acid export membrane protein